MRAEHEAADDARTPASVPIPKAVGIAVVIWSYARSSSLSKAGETAIAVIGDATQIAAQLGARIIKGEAAERVKHVVQCAFDGRRIVIFSDGASAPPLPSVRNSHLLPT